MTSPPGRSSKPLSSTALRQLVSDLAGKIDRLEQEVEQLRLDNSNLRRDNQALKDEIARLKHLPPRPPFKPSGMEKATEPRPTGSGRRPGRGAKRDRVTREVTLQVEVPPGSRFKGYKTVVQRDLILTAEVVRYKRERWVTPEGQTIIAPLPVGVTGGYGPGVRRFCLALHTQGQVTTERLTDLLNGIGLSISKREVVRLLTTDLELFEQEDRAVLQTGLTSSPYITVDDTGARHARRPGVTTQIGGERFCVFRTSRSKSRLNFLSLLRAGHEDYVVNEAALDYLRAQSVEAAVVARLSKLQGQVFRSDLEWLEQLARCSINIFDRPLLQTLNEAATWGAIRHHGLMDNTVVVSDDAGQFRVAQHALCWVHAERHLQKLMPASPKQAKAVELVRETIWCFYRSLKLWKQSPTAGAEALFRRQFNRIFNQRTGYKELDELLARLARRKSELLRVLERPEIPLHTNASENDLRAWVTKRKVSGGTMSVDGRLARDVMLGLSKTCRKLGLSFFDYLGDRLGLNGAQPKIPPLANLVIRSA
ncbi:transposase [Microvirga sp. VF16]|uniref:IS66 family transposase n=1 Tax=Microvirga sp. VF16 TaxID=2807101 RepID=UPI00193D621A|nr:transposase [Microvirga sp. VF16]QRM32161.1 transposase [Microvirga sp. VF16]QRM33012.1 transposase [Microvirga sp. VF16]